jgi:hypothetical protein
MLRVVYLTVVIHQLTFWGMQQAWLTSSFIYHEDDNKEMKQLFIVVVGLVLLATIPILVQTQVQAQSTTSTYENPAIGLKFEYPAEWELRNNPIGLTMSPDEDSVFSLEVVSLDRLGIPNPTLKDYAQYGYQLCCGTMSTPINDNQTTIGQNYTAQQYEYTFGGVLGTRQGIDVWVIDNGIGYQFEYISDPGPSFSQNLPAVRKILDSVQFIHIEVEEPKVPSFMQ